ncbi:GPW/gp25 family protein [Undibacterium sp. SXout7W]|uniref:GPW/gp25 family protein n=1 Tax=Undibacterium sp. SXout7W TaxID=3413049 RepID=UPI003BF22038
MNISTGERIAGLAHLRQSIADILTTPIGARVMRRDYGSLLFELIDQPHNGATQVRLYAATAEALLKWEPRIKLTQVKLYRTDTPGKVIIDLKGQLVRTSKALSLSLSVAVKVQA